MGARPVDAVVYMRTNSTCVQYFDRDTFDYNNRCNRAYKGAKIKPFSLHNFMQSAYMGRILNDFRKIFT